MKVNYMVHSVPSICDINWTSSMTKADQIRCAFALYAYTEIQRSVKFNRRSLPFVGIPCIISHDTLEKDMFLLNTAKRYFCCECDLNLLIQFGNIRSRAMETEGQTVSASVWTETNQSHQHLVVLRLPWIRPTSVSLVKFGCTNPRIQWEIA